MTIEEIFSSIKGYLKEKTNTFFATFFIVWVVYNWKVVYAFFFFDKGYDTLEKKQHYFIAYWNGTFVANLFTIIGISFLVFVSSLILKYASQLIINFFVDIVSPIVYKTTKKSNIVEYEKYRLEIERNSKLELDIINERAGRITAEREKEEIERNYKSAEYQLRQDVKNEIINRLKEIDNYGVETLVDFFKNLSEHQYYEPTELIERMLRSRIVVTREKNGTSYKLMITEYGDKIRNLIREYKGF